MTLYCWTWMAPKYFWQLGGVVEVYPGKDGIVCTCQVKSMDKLTLRCTVQEMTSLWSHPNLTEGIGGCWWMRRWRSTERCISRVEHFLKRTLEFFFTTSKDGGYWRDLLSLLHVSAVPRLKPPHRSQRLTFCFLNWSMDSCAGMGIKKVFCSN